MSDQNSGKVANNTTEPTQHAPAQGQALTGPAIYKESDAEDRKKRRYKKLGKAYLWVEAVCAVALVGITGAYTHYASVQKQAMLDSNEINRQSLYSTQRAFVAYDGISQEVINLTDARDKIVDHAFQMAAKWINVGNTPAVDVVIMVGWAEEQKDEPTEDMFLGKGLVTTTNGVAVIGPRQPFESADFFKPLSFADPKEDQRYIWGFVSYRDTFPSTKPHVSEFCNRIVFAEKVPKQNVYRFTAGICRQHNCMDEVCDDYSAVLRRVTELHH